MINFAHGEVFMIGAFISLIGFMICAKLGIGSGAVAIVLVLLLAMAFTAIYGWAIERTAYRPLRGSFKLAPLISAIGVSIMLQNYVQLAQGARPKPAGQIVEGGFNLFSADGFDVRVTWLQIIIVIVTVSLMAGFSWLIASTSLGRQQRACEQDMKMASLLGVNVDRTISLTFVMGAALAAVAGMMFLMYYGIVDFFIGFLAGIKAFTAAVLGGIGSLAGAMLGGLLIGLIEVFWAGYFSSEYKDVAVFGILVLVLIFRPTGLLGKPEIEKV
jgi:branched-chain amino acid transport system permease protein